MSITRIVTDSTAELCPEIVEALNITVVPMRIRLGTEVMVDGPELRTPEFYHTWPGERVADGAHPHGGRVRPRPSAPGARTNDIVTITVRGPQQHRARHAGRTGLLGRMNPVIDSSLPPGVGDTGGGCGQGRCAGASSAEVVRLVRGAISRIYFASTPRRWITCSATACMTNRGTLGSSSGVEPLLMIEEGEITAVQRMRNRGTPVERLFEFVAEFPKVTVVDVLHTGLIPGASEIKSQVEQLYPGQTVGEHIIGPTFSAYAGPRCLGVVVCDN